jgi:RNA polymerase sigma factor (sigma-70 family)
MKPTSSRDLKAFRPDAELVLAARRGDKRAFVEIVARHQAMVCGIALGILGDFAASEDAGQEAFLTAWRKIHELREPDRLRAWLAQIARNAALGQLRRTRGRDALDEDLAVADDALAPDETAANEDDLAMVRSALLKLPEAYRLPMVLFYREGQSVAAVAQALELSEDAVKQRLARGREMLRERMAGLVETVLAHNRPTAVFTMLVAAAIGALAAPAAVAGSVFAAASVAGASTATSSTTSLFTAMSTSKAFLVASALVTVLCVPIGYQIYTAPMSAALRPKDPASQAERTLARADSALSLDNSRLLAEWRGLHERYGTNAQAMPLLYEAINQLKDRFRRQAFHAALIAEWVQVDPKGGLRFFLAKGLDSRQRRQFFEEWLASDPRAAVDGLLGGGTGWEAMARESLSEIARRLPARVSEIASRLPGPDGFWDNSVRDAFAVLADAGLPGAREAAEALTGPNRSQALAGIARTWAKTDLDAAISWAKSLPDGVDRNEIIRAALLGRATVDPASALELVGTVPSGGREAYFASTTGARVLSEAADANFDATVAWLQANPARLPGQDLDGLGAAVTERLNADPVQFLNLHAGDGSLSLLLPAIGSALLNNASGQRTAVWDWLQTQPDNQSTRALRQQVLNSAAWQDPGLAMRLVGDLPQNSEGDALVQELARNLFNGGSMLGRFDTLLAQAPDRLRQPLIHTAFELLSGASLDDPQPWLARLPLLPDAERAQAMDSIARAWAVQRPEEAAGWANSLTPADSRNGAVAAVASTWAHSDPYGAADWLATLPAGAERDASAQAFVAAVADKFPQEAWTWALSISDPTQRNGAAEQALKAMAVRDPATARQWIETGPFPAEAKAAMLTELSQLNQAPKPH